MNKYLLVLVLGGSGTAISLAVFVVIFIHKLMAAFGIVFLFAMITLALKFIVI